MPKFKKGDEFAYRDAPSKPVGIVHDLIAVDGVQYYIIKIHEADRPGIQTSGYGDKAWTLMPKYEVGDIWRNKDYAEVFLVIENPYGDDELYLQRLNAGRPFSYSPPGYWINLYGELVKFDG